VQKALRGTFSSIHVARNTQVNCSELIVPQLLEYDLAFAMNSGSEAVETGIKIARKWGYNVKGIPSDQALVLTIKDNYHGKTMGPLSASSTEYIRRDFGPFVPGVSPSIDGRLIRWNNLEDLEWAFQQKGNTLAALMIECVQGHAGCLPCSDEYLQGASELCKRYRVLLIADEIQSGFGRTGHLMAYQAARIRPDMVTLGKAMTGGVIPMSMVVGTRECMGQLQYGE
jgi:ornithine--oxo-acid transaminase